MQSLLKISVLVIVLATNTPRLTDTGLSSDAVNCKEGGWTSCCKKGECYIPARHCFCDFSCHEFGDCCADIADTCPKTDTSHACITGEVRITSGVSDGIAFCINGSFTQICNSGESTIKALLHGNILKRQAEGDGSGSGSGNIVEVGFVQGNYTVAESELKMMVCVEVKSGILTPAESALVTVSTSPGTATAGVDYETIVEDVVFDGHTFENLLCIEIPIFNDVFFEPTEYFSVDLISSSPNLILADGMMSATVSIESTGTFPEDSCAVAGFAAQCCEDPVDQCRSLSSSCSCDLSCFQMGDCCEDIFMYAVELSTNNVYVDEDGEAVAVCAVVTGRYDNMDENITVILRFTDSPLTVGGDDYQPHSTELEFPTGQQQWQEDDIVQCVNIDIVDDSSVEGEHAFTVDITSVSPSSVVQCPITTTVHIQDNDVAVVSLVPLPETVLEEDPLSVCAMLSGVNYTDIPFTVNFTIHSGQATILTSQVVFPAGEITNSTRNASSGLVECSMVSVDNDMLDWSWQLTVSLDTLHHDQLTFLPSSLLSHSTTVMDDEANSASLSFQFTGAAVIGGHHTVLCVVLDGIPAGGMSEDLSVLLNLTNSTAELGSDFSLGASSTAASITLLFRRGSSRISVESTQCGLIDTAEIVECRDDVHFSMNITSTTPQVRLQEPLTATVTITDSNTTCICPVADIDPQSERESLYFTLLLVISALAAVLLVVVVVFYCYYRRQRRQYSKDIRSGFNAKATVLQNSMAYSVSDGRAKTLSSVTYNSFGASKDSDTSAAIVARNQVVRSTAIAQDYEDVEPEDMVLATATGFADYEEPIPHASPMITPRITRTQTATTQV